MITAGDTNSHSHDAVFLLSVKDLAKCLSVSKRTIWRLDSAGRIPQAVTIGGSKRWRREEIEAWCSAGCPDRVEWEHRKRLEACR